MSSSIMLKKLINRDLKFWKSETCIILILLIKKMFSHYIYILFQISYIIPIVQQVGSVVWGPIYTYWSDY